MRSLILLTIIFCLSGCGFSGLMKKGKVADVPASSNIEVEYKRKLLFTEVKVNGVKKRFAFDTGAPCVVSPELKKELGLKTIARHGIRDSHGQVQQLEFVRLREFKVGDIEFKNMIAIVTDLSMVKCYEMEGLIGANAMRHLNWYFDLKEELAIVYNTDVWDSLSTDRTFSVEFEPNIQFTPVVKVYTSGMKRSVIASFDMGSTGSLTLKGDLGALARSYEERSWMYGKTSRSVFGTKADTSHYFISKELEIGGRSFTDQLVKGGNSNLVGNSLLQDYKFLLSYERNKILFDPKKKDVQTLPKTKIIIGEEKDSLRVMGIRETGSEIPVSVDDVILSINGEEMSELGEMELCQLHKREWQVLEMRILRSDGTQYELELPREAVFKPTE